MGDDITVKHQFQGPEILSPYNLIPCHIPVSQAASKAA